MVVVEGVARSLDPRLDMWSTAEPVVASWIREKLGPAGMIQDAGRGLSALGRFAGQLPDFVGRAEALADDIERMARHGVELSPGSVEAIGRAEARRARWGNAALWTIAALLAAMLLIG
jgi:ubiquinone biosynthesis protein